MNKHPFFSLFSAKFLEFLCFLLVIYLLKMASKHTAKVLFSVPKGTKVVMSLMEKMHLLDKLPSGMSYSSLL